MPDQVRIAKDGLWEGKWKDGTTKWEKADNPIPFLRLNCTIDEGVILLDIFNMVESYPELMRFLEQYSWASHIEDWHLEARQPVKESPHIRVLEIYRHINIWDHDTEVGYGFHGLTTEEDGIPWSVSYTPLYKIAYLPVVLDPVMDVYDSRKPYKSKPIATNEATYTLLEILDAIYFDITWNGTPEIRQEKLQAIHDYIQKIKKTK